MSTSLMVEILGRLRKHMNGEVSERMAAHGVEYALNYGVAIHSLKEIAQTYAPNTKLARLLYCQQVRDLQILACYIANPLDVKLADEEFWLKGITTGEIAEQLSGLLARSEDSDQFVEKWLASDDAHVRYCALLTAAKTRNASNAVCVADYTKEMANNVSDVEIRVIATILSTHHTIPHVANVIDYIKNSNRLIHKQVSEEIYVWED